jgi:lipopolysaccharide transport system permease protein
MNSHLNLNLSLNLNLKAKVKVKVEISLTPTTNSNLNNKANITDTNPEQWDLVIRPKRHLLDINIKEIWDYRDLVMLFVRRDFVAKYKQTILGPLWFILNPLINTLMYTLVFAGIAKIPTEGIPPQLFYLSGIVSWSYFAACLNGTSSTFSSNAGIFGKVYFPRLVSPVSVIISSMVQLGIQFLLLAVFMIYYHFAGYGIQINSYILYIPLIIINLALLGLGFGIIFSALTTKYRDLTNLLGFGVQLWMYITPVIYPSSAVPEKYRILLLLNPVAPLVEAFKYGVIGAGEFNPGRLLYSVVFTCILLFVGVILFNRTEQNFMDTV